MMENQSSSVEFTWTFVMVCNRNIITSLPYQVQDSLRMANMVSDAVDQLARLETGREQLLTKLPKQLLQLLQLLQMLLLLQLLQPKAFQEWAKL